MLLAIAAMQAQPDAGFAERTQALAIPGSTCKDSARNTQVHPRHLLFSRHPNHAIRRSGGSTSYWLALTREAVYMQLKPRALMPYSAPSCSHARAGIGPSSECCRCASGEKAWVPVQALRCGTAKVIRRVPVVARKSSSISNMERERRKEEAKKRRREARYQELLTAKSREATRS